MDHLDSKRPEHRLSAATLETCPAPVERPSYDRSKITAGIVHIGVGGFHRAHQAVYLDDLLSQGLGFDWGIIGLGLMPQDKAMGDALGPQDYLYTVIEQDQHGSRARVIGSIIDFIHGPTESERALKTLCLPSIRIVSLTVTEGGYNIDQATEQFIADKPAILAEAQEGRTETVFGFLVKALDLRRRAGIEPFTVLSCDNLVHNGKLAKRAICAFARLQNPDLANWIESHVAFPNTMVDRITPVTSQETRVLADRLLGLHDGWPVACESFRQWVIEDSFCNGRPPFESVGVQMTGDVTPYELIKIRLLNAGHSAIGYLGHLCKFEYIFEIMRDADFQRFLWAFWKQEVGQTLNGAPGVDLVEYQKSLFERFSNPNIRDQTLRICSDGSNKIPKFLLPSIRDALAKGAPIKLMSLVVASWMRFMTGVDEEGAEFPVNDPRASTIKAQVLRAQTQSGAVDPREILNDQEIFGDLGGNPRFIAHVSDALTSLYQIGARQTLLRMLE